MEVHGADTKQDLLAYSCKSVKACVGCITRWKKTMAGGQQADLRPFVLKIKIYFSSSLQGSKANDKWKKQ